jgi:thioredoxin-dependent peroxiredoxin
VVVGISADTLQLQQKFVDKEKLNFPLLADNELKTIKELGVLGPSKTVARRVSFVIDKEGVVRKIYPNVKPGDHPEEVVQFIKTELVKK